MTSTPQLDGSVQNFNHKALHNAAGFIGMGLSFFSTWEQLLLTWSSTPELSIKTLETILILYALRIHHGWSRDVKIQIFLGEHAPGP